MPFNWFILSLGDIPVFFCGIFSSVSWGKMLRSLLHEISMTSWETHFDLMLTGLFPIAWRKYLTLDRGLNFFFYFLRPFAYEVSWMYHGIASARFIMSYRALVLLILLLAWISLIALSVFFFQLILPAMWPSSQLGNIASLMQSSATWSFSLQLRQFSVCLQRFLVWSYL